MATDVFGEGTRRQGDGAIEKELAPGAVKDSTTRPRTSENTDRKAGYSLTPIPEYKERIDTYNEITTST